MPILIARYMVCFFVSEALARVLLKDILGAKNIISFCSMVAQTVRWERPCVIFPNGIPCPMGSRRQCLRI